MRAIGEYTKYNAKINISRARANITTSLFIHEMNMKVQKLHEIIHEIGFMNN